MNHIFCKLLCSLLQNIHLSWSSVTLGKNRNKYCLNKDCSNLLLFFFFFFALKHTGTLFRGNFKYLKSEKSYISVSPGAKCSVMWADKEFTTLHNRVKLSSNSKSGTCRACTARQGRIGSSSSALFILILYCYIVMSAYCSRTRCCDKKDSPFSDMVLIALQIWKLPSGPLQWKIWRMDF